MPPLGAGVTLVPATTPIIANATNWSPLGGSSGACWSTGCGNSGWIQMLYTPAAGNYQLVFGVVNVNDTAYDSGMAVAGAKIGGAPKSIPARSPNPRRWRCSVWVWPVWPPAVARSSKVQAPPRFSSARLVETRRAFLFRSGRFSPGPRTTSTQPLPRGPPKLLPHAAARTPATVRATA